MLYLLNIRNNIIDVFFGKIIDKVTTYFEKMGLTPFVIFSIPIIAFSVWFLSLYINRIKRTKTTYEKVLFIYIFVLVILGLSVCIYCIIMDQRRILFQMH